MSIFLKKSQHPDRKGGWVNPYDSPIESIALKKIKSENVGHFVLFFSAFFVQSDHSAALAENKEGLRF